MPLETILILKVLQLDVCAPNSHYMLLTSHYKSQLEVTSFLLVGPNWKVLCYVQVQNVLSELEFLPLINIAFVTYFLNSLSLEIPLKQIPSFYIQSECMVESLQIMQCNEQEHDFIPLLLERIKMSFSLPINYLHIVFYLII